MSGPTAAPYAFADLTLARRLERAEGQSNKDFVNARARVHPESGARWIDVAGTAAMFDGVDSPLTQTFGLGMFEPPTAAHFDQLEQFFVERGAPVFHEVSPLADPAALSLLTGRSYRPIEYTSVMSRPIVADAAVGDDAASAIQVRVVGRDEHGLWADTAAEGWSETPGVTEFMRSLSAISAVRENTVSFLAEIGSRPVATGALCLCEGVALLAGASTVPGGRKQGAQLALLDARFRYAARQGCDIAMMCAAPGSASQRNAERQGFRIAYTRIKWKRVIG